VIDSKLPAGCEEAARRPPKLGVATATSTRRPGSTPNSTTFSRQLACWSTTSYPSAEAPGGRADHGRRAHNAGDRPCLHGTAERRQFLALAGYRLSHLFAYLPRRSGYNKRLRVLTPQIAPRATQAFAETTNGGSGSLSLQSSRNAVRRSGSL
jgi:hypothetical protein